MRKITMIPLMLTAIILITGCNKNVKESGKITFGIIPQPEEMTVNEGNFTIGPRTAIYLNPVNSGSSGIAQAFSSKIYLTAGYTVIIDKYSGRSGKDEIIMTLDTNLDSDLGKEGYSLKVDKKRIEIKAAHPAGLFYGMQTIYQLLPPEIFLETPPEVPLDLKVQCVEITDRPSYTWRGMHLDVSRHFFPKEFIKKYIDLIAMHKMNIFHWHLTDDNGWRIEIKKYPLLTKVGAWRADREKMPWNDRNPQEQGEKAAYGGFYTQADIREIIQYAQERYVIIIPEIEMPGHTSEVFAAYPEYSCTGKKLTVAPGGYWPNIDIYCAGKEETFSFLEDVLSEVADLFPSDYIHIGGDEADKTRWKACPKCQARIRAEGLANEDELQSYFIKRIEKILIGKGKKLIGWDEILEGGLAPEATVMSWRGFEGGMEAARQGHDVIMCPTSHCYFDYYQADPDYQPAAIGGLTTLKKVYSFRPAPAEMTREEAKHVLGGQGNLWTEYIPDPEQAEYMAVPRMSALAEVLWSPEKVLDWDSFRNRLQIQLRRFDHLKVNYSDGSFRVDIAPQYDSLQNKFFIVLATESASSEIHYTLDGSEPGINAPLYSQPINISDALTLKAIAAKGGKFMEKSVKYKLAYHLGIGKTVKYNVLPSFKYPGSSEFALADGLIGSTKYDDGLWQGFEGKNLDVIIDLGTEYDIKYIGATFLQDQNHRIFKPQMVSFAVSSDGINYEDLGAWYNTIIKETDTPIILNFYSDFETQIKARFIYLKAENIGACPSWHPGKGEKAWIFADEITVK